MKPLAQWLDRKPAGPAKRKRLPAFSARRKKDGAVYTKLRREFLAAHPFCQVWIATMRLDEAAVIQWDGIYCTLNGAFRFAPRATEIHHKAGRYGGNYLNVTTWAAVCRDSHRWLHDNPKLAKAEGWLT
jgi:hypothetical protein